MSEEHQKFVRDRDAPIATDRDHDSNTNSSMDSDVGFMTATTVLRRMIAQMQSVRKRSRSECDASDDSGGDEHESERDDDNDEYDNGYEYSRVADVNARNPMQKWFLYGIIVDYKPAQPTKGTDYSMQVTIVDESVAERGVQGGLCVVFMERERESLPDVEHVGQIIRLHRLRFTNYRGNVQGQGRKSFGFDHLVLSDNLDEPVPRERIANKTFTMRDQRRIRELRRFGRQFLGSPRANLCNQYMTTLAQIDGNRQYIDLLCIKVGHERTADGSFNMTVFDGSKLFGKRDFADVTVLDMHLKLIVEKIEDFDIIRLRNIAVQTQRASDSENPEETPFVLRTQANSGICVLPSYHFNSLELRRKWNEWEASSKERDAQMNSTPVLLIHNRHTKVEISSIRNILDSEADIYRFKCRAKVVSFAPKIISNFARPYCPNCEHVVIDLAEDGTGNCPHCDKKNIRGFQYKYMVVMKLRDASACMMVQLYDDIAEQFFGLQACDLTVYSETRAKLSDMMQLLVSQDQIEVCVESFVNNRNKRSYRLFSTFATLQNLQV